MYPDAPDSRFYVHVRTRARVCVQAPSPTERHANMLVRFSSRMVGEGLTDRADGAPPPGLNDLYFCTSENGRLVRL
jgi:hypothetical protein